MGWEEMIRRKRAIPNRTKRFCTTVLKLSLIHISSFGSSDNCARYVSEYDYIAHFKKQPESNRYFKPLGWPESQLYLFQDESRCV